MARPSHRRRSRRQLLFGLLLGLLLTGGFWGGGLWIFAGALPTTVADPDSYADAVVVLTGGSGRLAEGLRLLGDGRAPRLFVSGVYRGIDVNRLLAMSIDAPDALRCCVEIGHSADNTAGNADETAKWVRAAGLKSIRLVTSSYHLPRAMLEFARRLPAVTIIAHPVFADNVKQDRWWAWPGTANLIVSEYNKFLLAWLLGLGLDVAGYPSDDAQSGPAAKD